MTISSAGTKEHQTGILFPKSELNRFIVDQSQVSEIRRQLNVNKSMGHDNIGSLILKSCHKTLSKSLTLIFQTCLHKKIFPEIWKISEVTPVFKEGSKTDVSCYRPISLLCCCSKLLEKIIFDKLYTKVKYRLHESQHGFRKRRSATIQLLLFLDRIYELNNQQDVQELAVLYLDFAKAFDTVPHDILLTKIKIFGIGGKLLSLIYSYLNNRKQCVKIEDCSSTLKEVTSGVPQGSILGPLLFLLFIKDLPETMNDTDSFGYADDFKAILLNQTSLDTATLKVEKWLHENKMQPNIKKSTLLGIKGDLKASLLNKNLSSVNSQRDLGLIVSNKLTWNKNCSRRTSKAISALFQIKRSLTMKSSGTTRLNAYTGYVVPIVTYASQAWTPSRSKMEQLERVQKLATKWILGTSKTYTERLKDLNLLPLNLYMEMHDILIPIALLENRSDVEIERKPSESCKITRQSS